MPTGLLFKGWHDPPTIHPSMTPPLPMPGSWLPSAAAPPPSRCGPGHGPSDRPARPGMGNAMSPLGSWRYPPNSEPLAENHLRSPGLLSNILQNHLDLGAKHAFWVLKLFWRITSCFYWLKPGVQTRIRMITNMFMAKITFVALPTNDVYLDDIYLDWCAINLFIYIYIIYTSIYIQTRKYSQTCVYTCLGIPK